MVCDFGFWVAGFVLCCTGVLCILLLLGFRVWGFGSGSVWVDALRCFDVCWWFACGLV